MSFENWFSIDCWEVNLKLLLLILASYEVLWVDYLFKTFKISIAGGCMFWWLFTHISRYLTFKFYVWKRICIIPFELQKPQNLSTPFLKALAKFSRGKQILEPFNDTYDFYEPLSFLITFTFKGLKLQWLYNYINVLYHTIDTCHVTC